MSRILVCPAEYAEAVAAEYGPSHVVALTTPDSHLPIIPGGPKGRDGHAGFSLSLSFNDIVAPHAGLVSPSRADIAALLAVARTWDGTRPFLVHCRMGISRSTAAALAIAAASGPKLGEQALASALRTALPCATPNALMIALADDLLGREGLLVEAVRAIGRGADYAPYRMFALDLDALA